MLNNAQLKLRLKTLLDKKKVMQGRNVSASKISASFITLEEGFQQFGSDLNKLQVALSPMMLLPANKYLPAIHRAKRHCLFQDSQKGMLLMIIQFGLTC